MKDIQGDQELLNKVVTEIFGDCSGRQFWAVVSWTSLLTTLTASLHEDDLFWLTAQVHTLI